MSLRKDRSVPERTEEEDAHERIAQERLRDIELLGGPHDPMLERGEGPNLGPDPHDHMAHAQNKD